MLLNLSSYVNSPPNHFFIRLPYSSSPPFIDDEALQRRHAPIRGHQPHYGSPPEAPQSS